MDTGYIRIPKISTGLDKCSFCVLSNSSLDVSLQVKRCAEMSIKLRFFKDQISKAGLAISGHFGMQPDLELEDLEVIPFF